MGCNFSLLHLKLRNDDRILRHCHICLISHTVFMTWWYLDTYSRSANRCFVPTTNDYVEICPIVANSSTLSHALQQLSYWPPLVSRWYCVYTADSQKNHVGLPRFLPCWTNLITSLNWLPIMQVPMASSTLDIAILRPSRHCCVHPKWLTVHFSNLVATKTPAHERYCKLITCYRQAGVNLRWGGVPRRTSYQAGVRTAKSVLSWMTIVVCHLSS